MRIDNLNLVGKMFENVSPGSVRSGRTCPANLGVQSCPVRKLISPVPPSPSADQQVANHPKWFRRPCRNILHNNALLPQGASYKQENLINSAYSFFPYEFQSIIKKAIYDNNATHNIVQEGKYLFTCLGQSHMLFQMEFQSESCRELSKNSVVI